MRRCSLELVELNSGSCKGGRREGILKRTVGDKGSYRGQREKTGSTQLVLVSFILVGGILGLEPMASRMLASVVP
jgi:hypothetical protein